MTLLCQCNRNSSTECKSPPIYHFDPIIQFMLQSKEFIAMLASAAVPICKKKLSKESAVPK